MGNQFKVRLYQALIQEVEQRAQNLQDSLADALDSTANETKSTAGDKHETGRAMAQLEQEKIGSQLAEITKLKEILFRIQPEKTCSKVELGSIVESSAGIFFISIFHHIRSINLIFNFHYYTCESQIKIVYFYHS